MNDPTAPIFASVHRQALQDRKRASMITVLDLAIHWGATPHPATGAVSVEAITSRGLPAFGGCAGCEASLGAFNAYPTTSGVLMCFDCADASGTAFPTCQAAERGMTGLAHVAETRVWLFTLSDLPVRLGGQGRPDAEVRLSAPSYQSAAEAIRRDYSEWMIKGYVETTEPREGGPATFTLWSDSHACTVAEIKLDKAGQAKLVTLRQDRAVLLNGVNSGEPDALQFSPGGFAGHTSGHQRYNYFPNPEGRTYQVSRRVVRGNTVWKLVGQSSKEPGGFAQFGLRSETYDFNF